jgi:hypothetical protein
MSKDKDLDEGTVAAPNGDSAGDTGTGIWKLLLAIVVILALFVSLPYILGTFGLMPPLSSKAIYILIITAGGLVFKILFGDMISGKFEYQRQGYDLCIITLGASLSLLSLQITSDHDLFPDLPKARLLTVIASLTPNAISQRILLLLGIFLLSCILSLVTARIGMAIRQEKTKGKSYLSLLNFVLGSGVFGTYILLLITKG